MGVRFEPDPCSRGCIWQTFSADAMECWSLFQTVTKRWDDPKTKEPRFEIDWGAVSVVLRARGIEDEERAIAMIFKIIGMVAHPEVMTDEKLFGWDEDEA